LPDVTELQSKVLEDLSDEQKAKFEEQLGKGNLEEALSRVRRIAALLEGGDSVDGLTGSDAHALDKAVCGAIVKSLSLDTADLDPALRLAAWTSRADYRWPIEIFTVNYDLILETAFEKLGATYFDGFVGALRAQFREDLVEASPDTRDRWLPQSFVRLWKLHGSVNWAVKLGPPLELYRMGAPAPAGHAAAIYPSDTKYDESRRVPFVVLQDRLRHALAHPETLMLVSGYSFGDGHINEVLFEAAVRRPRSELIVFCFGDIPDVVAERAEQTPNLQVISDKEAILGGIRAEWEEPDSAADPPDDVWAGGRMVMGDFAQLVTYLARSSPPDDELRETLDRLLKTAAEADGGS
jgi:hypothetical protein